MDATATTPVRVIVEGVVTRCTCTESEKAAPDWHALRNEPCPKGRTERRRTLADSGRSPVRRLLDYLRRLAR